MSNSFRNKKKAVKPAEKPVETSVFSKTTLSNDGQYAFLTGVFLILLSVFFLFAFSSFLFSGNSDQDLLQHEVGEIVGHKSGKAANILGWLGANISHWFIDIWFGLSAFLIIPVLFLVGFRLIFKEDLFKFSLNRFIIGSTFYLFFVSVFLGFFVYVFNLKTTLLSGNLGYVANDFLFTLVGYGSILIILLILLIWLIFFHGLTTVDDYIFTKYFPGKKKFLYRDIEKYDFTEEEIQDQDITPKEDLSDKKIVNKPKIEFESPLTEEREVKFEPNSLAKEPFKGGKIEFTVEKPASLGFSAKHIMLSA